MSSIVNAFAPQQYLSGLAGQSSTGVSVTIHRQPRLNALFGIEQTQEKIVCRGQNDRDNNNPSVIGVQTQCDLHGGTAFTLALKSRLDLLEMVQDDDWVDIHFIRNRATWHIVRGIVDEVRQADSIGAGGSTTRSYEISGRGFEKIWQNTPMWFETTIGENAGSLDVTAVFKPLDNIGQRTVPGVVYAFLWRFFLHLVGKGRNGFSAPPSLADFTYQFVDTDSTSEVFEHKPLVSLDDSPFSSFIGFDAAQYNNFINNRFGIAENFFYPDVSLWDAAMQWSDPVYCELFCDLMPTPGASKLLGKVNPHADGFSDSRMTVLLRDKPFVLGTNAVGQGFAYPQLPAAALSAWFSLPRNVIPRQLVSGSNIGRSGYERFNAFHHSMQTGITGTDSSSQGNTPNWSLPEIRRHGLRRFDAQSRYQPGAGFSPFFFASRKQQARDWYGIGGDLYQGQIALGCGLPGARVGHRLHIVGPDTAHDEHYYIESVAHTYAPQTGFQTNLGVTRGYRGPEAAIVGIVNAATSRYQEGKGNTPATEATGGLP